MALAKVTRDGFGRFVRIEQLRACAGGDCDAQPDTWTAQYQQIDAALETIAQFVESDDPDDRELGAEVLHAFRERIRADAAEIEQAQRGRRNDLLRSQYQESEIAAAGDTYAMLESREIDAADLTGLEPDDARRLALRIKAWNPHVTKVYEWRNGKRYIHRDVARLDLNDQTVRDVGIADDLWPIVREKHLPMHYGER